MNSIKDTPIGNIINIIAGIVFFIAFVVFINKGMGTDEAAQSAVHQILSAVYYCCGFLSFICGSICIKFKS